jgi:hypothetical protein
MAKKVMTQSHRHNHTFLLRVIFVLSFIFTLNVSQAHAQGTPIACCCNNTTGVCVDAGSPPNRCPDANESFQAFGDGACSDYNILEYWGLPLPGSGDSTAEGSKDDSPTKPKECTGWVCRILRGRHLVPEECRVGPQQKVCATNKSIPCVKNKEGVLVCMARSDRIGSGGETYTGSASTCVESCGINEVLLLFTNIKDLLLGILGSFALLMFVYGGVVFLTSGGNQERVTQGKTILRNAVIGLILVFVSWIIVNFILTALTGGKIGETGKIFNQSVNAPPDSRK